MATEECVDVTEDGKKRLHCSRETLRPSFSVPIRLCKKRDRSREPKARLVSAPYTERN